MIGTSTRFSQISQGVIRPLAIDAMVSFSKQRNPSVDWFVLDVSELDGGDILATEGNEPIQPWDAYEYQSVKDDIIDMSWSRSVEFPYNVQSAICDISLNNTTGKYTYGNQSSPIGSEILPSRPIRTYAGFVTDGSREVVPVFVGLTQKTPNYNGQHETVATFTAMDFLSEISNMTLTQTSMYQNARTDQVIADILDQFGLDPSMYSLSKGLNIIPFAYFEKGQNAGDVLRKLVEAENGSLWLNEKGIIRFEPRGGSVAKIDSMAFDDSNIIEIQASHEDGIVNHVRIRSDVRQIQDSQPIFSAANENGYSSMANEDAYRLRANATTDVWLNFDDPIWTANTTPVLDGTADTSNFTALDLAGNPVHSGITCTGTLFADSIKLEFTNTNNFPVSVSYLEVWGQPARVVDTIKYDAYDEDSVEAFGEKVLEITDNDYFATYQNVDAFAEDILYRRKDYSPTLKMKVKGNPALQLGDAVTLSGDKAGRYSVIGIESKISISGGYECALTLEKSFYPFILDESQLDGADLLA